MTTDTERLFPAKNHASIQNDKEHRDEIPAKEEQARQENQNPRIIR